MANNFYFNLGKEISSEEIAFINREKAKQRSVFKGLLAAFLGIAPFMLICAFVTGFASILGGAFVWLSIFLAGKIYNAFNLRIEQLKMTCIMVMFFICLILSVVISTLFCGPFAIVQLLSVKTIIPIVGLIIACQEIAKELDFADRVWERHIRAVKNQQNKEIV